MSAGDSENYERNIQDKFKDLKILRIYGNMNDKLKEKIFKNVNEEFGKYDVVISTPTCESGVDYNIENYFYKVYGVISTYSTTVSGFFQMVARIRHVQNNEILIYSANMSLNRVNFYTFAEVKENLQTLFDIDEKTKNILCENGKLNIEDDKDYIKNYIFNQTEIFNSKLQYFIAYMKLLCKEKNYEFKYSHDNGEIKYEKNNYNKADVLSCFCPDEIQYEELKKKQDIGISTENDKNRIAKYYYFIVVLGYTMKDVRKIEEEQEKRLQKEEGNFDFSLNAEDEFNFVFKNNPINNFLSLIDIENFKKIGHLDFEQNLNSLKHLEFIKDVKEFLLYIGVDNITKECKIKDLKEKIEAKKDILGIFKYKIKDDGKIFEKKDNNKESDKQIIWDIKKLIGLFGCDIINDKKSNRTSVNGKITYIARYIFKPSEAILNIIKRKISRNKIHDNNNFLTNVKYEEDIFDIFNL
jgi:hypothetical protein